MTRHGAGACGQSGCARAMAVLTWARVWRCWCARALAVEQSAESKADRVAGGMSLDEAKHILNFDEAERVSGGGGGWLADGGRQWRTVGGAEEGASFD